MKEKFSFKVQPLLENTVLGISGPMSPVAFARDMGAANDLNFNRIGRVYLGDGLIYQWKEDDGLTGHDILILAEQNRTDLILTLWVDIGVGGISIALCMGNDRQVVFSDEVEEFPFAKRLTTEQIRELFDYVFDHPETIAVKGE